MTKIEMGRVYRTRDGREVRIYATDGGPLGDVVHGSYKAVKSGWIVTTWKADGCYAFDDSLNDLDLIEVKPRIKREVWVNVYPNENRSDLVHADKENADMFASANRIACVKLTIDCEEGEGL